MSEGPVGRDEMLQAQLAKIIADYWEGVRELKGDEGKIAVVKRIAVSAIKKLGYTEGDALRYLRPKGWRA
jgi:hypothetical protein